MGKIFKAAWDCEHCGKQDIPGDVRHCPSCGNPVGNNVKYHAPRNREYVDRSVVPSGPDWQCNYCGSYNRYEASVCSNCGGDKNGTKDYFNRDVSSESQPCREVPSESQPHVDRNEDRYERDHGHSYGSTDNTTYYHDNDNVNTTFVETLKQKFQSAKDAMSINPGVVLGIIGALVVIAGLIFLAVPREKELTITDMSWNRTLYIEKYTTVHDEGWDVPTGGRVTNSYLKVHHYDQVEDGYEIETYEVEVPDGYEVIGHKDVDLGNGYMDEQEVTRTKYKTETRTREVKKYKDVPVERTWYCYDIDKYVHSRTMTTSASDKSPYWPENAPVEKKNPKIGDERVSSRSEKYYAEGFVTDKPEKNVKYKLSFSDWDKINVGDTVRCKVSLLTGHMKLIDYENEEDEN